MKEKNIIVDLTNGKWDVTIYEIGNTYQIYAKNIEDQKKRVHFMVNKSGYLDYLKSKDTEKPSDKFFGLSCEGNKFLTENDFQTLRDLLYTHMDKDLYNEKKRLGLIFEE